MRVSESQSATGEAAVQAARTGRATSGWTIVGRYIVRGLNSGVFTAIAIILGLIWSVPTFGLFVSSFRPPSLISTTGWWSGLVPPWAFTIQNYAQVITAQGMGQAFLNSLIISIPGTIFPVLLGAFAAYAFAWMHFPGRDYLFIAIVGLLVVPSQIALVPMLQIFTDIGLTGQYAAVWLAHTAFGLPFAVFLLRNFFSSLPRDLMESAHIDGASHRLIFWNIILPLSVPALASLSIFQSCGSGTICWSR